MDRVSDQPVGGDLGGQGVGARKESRVSESTNAAGIVVEGVMGRGDDGLRRVSE